MAGKISSDGKTGVLIELNAETDFVSKNETFQSNAREIAQVALGVTNQAGVRQSGHVRSAAATSMEWRGCCCCCWFCAA